MENEEYQDNTLNTSDLSIIFPVYIKYTFSKILILNSIPAGRKPQVHLG